MEGLSREWLCIDDWTFSSTVKRIGFTLHGALGDIKTDIKVVQVELLSARLLIIYWERGEKHNVANPGEVSKGE